MRVATSGWPRGSGSGANCRTARSWGSPHHAGYGRRTSGRRRVRVAWSAAVALSWGWLSPAPTGCSIVSELTLPDESRTIVIPGTNALTTESSVAATSTSSANGPDDDGGDDAAPGAWDDYSYGHVISVAPRADAQRFHRAAKTSSAALITTSGYHFSSPDRAIQCSTGANGTGTSPAPHSSCTAPPPPGTPASCRWNPEMVTPRTRRPISGRLCESLSDNGPFDDPALWPDIGGGPVQMPQFGWGMWPSIISQDRLRHHQGRVSRDSGATSAPAQCADRRRMNAMSGPLRRGRLHNDTGDLSAFI